MIICEIRPLYRFWPFAKFKIAQSSRPLFLQYHDQTSSNNPRVRLRRTISIIYSTGISISNTITFNLKLEYCMKMHPSSRVLPWKKNDLNLWKIMMKSENCYCRNQEGILVKTWIYCIKGKYLMISFFIVASVFDTN